MPKQFWLSQRETPSVRKDTLYRIQSSGSWWSFHFRLSHDCVSSHVHEDFVHLTHTCHWNTQEKVGFKQQQSFRLNRNKTPQAWPDTAMFTSWGLGLVSCTGLNIETGVQGHQGDMSQRPFDPGVRIKVSSQKKKSHKTTRPHFQIWNYAINMETIFKKLYFWWSKNAVLGWKARWSTKWRIFTFIRVGVSGPYKSSHKPVNFFIEILMS